MRLPEDQLRLIERLCDTGKKVVVALFGGSPVELPFFDRVNAILYMGLPGQNGGEAAAQLYVDGVLAGFRKVYLKPGESATVTIEAEPADPADYPDTYAAPPLPPAYPLTLEPRFTDLRQSRMGRMLFRAVLSVAENQRRHLDIIEGKYR